MENQLVTCVAENEEQTREFCERLLSKLKSEHLDPVLQRLQGKEAAKVSFKEVIDRYNTINEDYHRLAKGAKDVIANVFFEFHPVRQYTFMLISFIIFHSCLNSAFINKTNKNMTA